MGELSSSAWTLVERGGVPGVLFVMCLYLAHLYRQERAENKLLHKEIAVVGKESVAAILSASKAIDSFKETLKELRDYINRMRD